MRTLSATEAARNLSDVLDAVEAGERFVVVRRGRAVARIEPASVETGRAVKALLRRAPRDVKWLDEIREARAMTTVEDRRWTD